MLSNSEGDVLYIKSRDDYSIYFSDKGRVTFKLRKVYFSVLNHNEISLAVLQCKNISLVELWKFYLEKSTHCACSVILSHSILNCYF